MPALSPTRVLLAFALYGATALACAQQPAALPAPPAATAPVLRVAALRLPARSDPAWTARREQIVLLLETLAADVVSVQQVLQEQQSNPACWLAARLEQRCDFITVDPPSQAQRRGSALLTRLPASADGITLLHPPGRYSAAGMVRVETGGQAVNIYAARLYPDDNDAASLQHQTGDLMAWITATSDGLPCILAGDFAAGGEELVRGLPGFQPARLDPLRPQESADEDGRHQHGLDVLFHVAAFEAVHLQEVELPAAEGQPALPLGVLATLRPRQLEAAGSPSAKAP